MKIKAILMALALSVMYSPAGAQNSSNGYQTFSYSHITTNASTQVYTGIGSLHGISINTKGASANTITVYDDTDCSTVPVMGVIDSTSNVQTLIYDIGFNTGLCIKTATGTAPDLTVIYRKGQ